MDNIVRSLEKAIKPAIFVGIFVALLLFGFCREARSEVTADSPNMGQDLLTVGYTF